MLLIQLSYMCRAQLFKTPLHEVSKQIIMRQKHLFFKNFILNNYYNKVNLHSFNTLTKNRKFIYCNRMEGMPKISDFKLIEEEIPNVKDGEIKTEALFLSVDPYMRNLAVTLPLGSVMIGSQIARVTESKHNSYKVGNIISGEIGWQTHFVGNPEEIEIPFYGKFKPQVLPDFKDIPYSYALGALGIPGVAAYFGLINICEPKLGETVVVNGAAGATGSLVGQIAKIKGCKVIGFAGSDEKVKWLTEELKFDNAYNYKITDVKKALNESAPNGVDCFFDNVGGSMSSSVIKYMNPLGRVAICGAISTYNKEGKDSASVRFNILLMKELRVQGFIITRYANLFPDMLKEMSHWLAQGKVKVRECIYDGFEKTPEALISLFTGDNIGKIIIKI